MDADELDLFAGAVRELTARWSGSELDAALAELGWADALAEDPRAAVSVLFEAQGASASTSTALDLVLTTALGVEPGRVVLPAFGTTAPPGIDEGAIRVGGVLLGGAGGDVLLPWSVGRDLHVAAVPTGSLTVAELGGIDPSSGWLRVAGELVCTAAPVASSWDEVVAAGQRAVAHELIGTSQAMLDLAREHALERIQFGRPIAGFQAVRHKLAESFVALESARAAVGAAWDEPTPFNASVAKAIAGRGSRLVSKHCQQVLAGIGFTAEHRFHHHLRRARVLDGLLGSSRSLTGSIGAQLLAAGGLPAILPLTAD